MEQYQTITMSRKELRKYEVIKKLIDGEINGTIAAAQLQCTVRWVKRLKTRVAQDGAQGVVHRARGRRGNRAFPLDKVEKIKTIVTRLYADFHPTFAAEKLRENHRIVIGKESMRQYMIQWALWKPKSRKKNKQYRMWRSRKERYGELQQFDGSYHRWFEQRAPECCLLAAIDDATGMPTRLWFDTDEGVSAVFRFWKAYIEDHGTPVAIYLDKFSTYKINHASAKDNQELITQFERAAKEVDIRLITAHSPEAKGRIERLFGTLQDRLVKELRLRNISTMEEANEFLANVYVTDFSKKFAVVAAQAGDAHRALSSEERARLPAIFSVHNTRTVANDFTIRFKNQWLQLAAEQPVLVRKKETVLIEQRLDDSLRVRLKNQYLDFTILPERPERVVNLKIPALTRTTSSWKPPANHPWRKSFAWSQKKRYQASSQPVNAP